MKKFKLIISTFLINALLVSGLTGCKTTTSKINNNKETANAQNATSSAGSQITTAAEKVIPSVVSITATYVDNNGNTVQGVGSGMIIDSNGYILTNNHVANADSKTITVSLYNGKDISAKPVWAQAGLDLSIIKINAANLPTVKFGDSSKVKVGENAIAIGNPLGLNFQRTVTSGIISAVNRTIEVSEGTFMEDLLQTDASINPGNSGGPLVNINGNVIGVNSAKITSAEGIGFSVPTNIIKPVLKSIKATGSFTTPVIGIVGFDKSMSGYLNTTFDRGIYIYSVSSGSGAYNAGIRKGDIILSMNGKDVKTVTDLREALYNTGVGNTLRIRARTASGEKDFNVTPKAAG
ncbi:MULTISPECIES: S1C family serine protease [Clostridium]|uniref:S1C family serine protease n=1 Tax=Clostridium TaxID=1485 RepID=UPI00069E58A2|nr:MULTISPECIES: trypsin-like peptidase domain-containing protein [Clostridium]KOF56007.1 peptidase S1 [Clostridium sp. DMHC 10]MCD2345472.1 trypsin-like peptidase domain-containing protein [Clostridium guangxiense]